MTDLSVCAVIVTYHPDASVIENIAAAFHQVSGLVVVDNGSNADQLVSLRDAQSHLAFHLIENGSNLGIAEALNQGIRWAKCQGFTWVILFDQDSRITEGFMQSMRTTWDGHPQAHRIGSLQPRYIDPDTGLEAPVWRAADGGPVKSMTSGSLIPCRLFDAVGYFASEYFIDDVDTEFCFRLRSKGYLIADSRSAELLHSSGTPRRMTLLGFSFSPSHHSATRRYYMSRNRVSVLLKYCNVFPSWMFKYGMECFKETVKCLIGEQDRTRKLKNIIRGTFDGLVGRMGEREGV